MIVAILGLVSIFLSLLFPSKEHLDQMTVELEKELELHRQKLEAGVKKE